jgi:hypothetical protein
MNGHHNRPTNDPQRRADHGIGDFSLNGPSTQNTLFDLTIHEAEQQLIFLLRTRQVAPACLMRDVGHA